MQDMDAIVVIGFQRKPDAAYTKTWKRLEGVSLEQRFTLPAALLAAGNLLGLTLDGVPRELRIEHLRWEHARQTLYVHLTPTEREAASLRALGIKAWRPWLRRRAIDEFLGRCRQSGWVQRAGSTVKPAQSPAASSTERVEPTL